MIDYAALRSDLVEQWQRFGWTEEQAKQFAEEMSDEEIMEWFEDVEDD